MFQTIDFWADIIYTSHVQNGRKFIIAQQAKNDRIRCRHMAQNTYRTQLILMFEKNCTDNLFSTKYKETNLWLGSESTTCQFGRFYKGASQTNFQIFPSKIGTFCSFWCKMFFAKNFA